MKRTMESQHTTHSCMLCSFIHMFCKLVSTDPSVICIVSCLLTISHSDLPSIHVACLSSVTMQVTLLEDGNREIALTIKGLTEYGYLLAVDMQGTAFALHPDGNRYCQLSCSCFMVMVMAQCSFLAAVWTSSKDSYAISFHPRRPGSR